MEVAPMMKRVVLGVLLTTCLCVRAQTPPSTSCPPPPCYSKPVTIVVPFSAGGGADMLARSLAERLQSSFGQPVVVDDKPGGGGTVGAASVAKSRPDGYTLLFTNASVLSVS